MVERFVSCSTRSVAAHRRVGFWNEQASQVITELQVQPDRAVPFEASLKAVDLAGVGFVEAISTPARVVHRYEMASRSEVPSYLIHLQRGGTCLNRQLHAEVRLGAGDFVLCDSTLPCELILGGDNHMLVLRIPQPMLKRRVPTPELFINRLMSGRGGASGLVSAFIDRFWAECLHGIDPATAEQLVEPVCDLLATALLEGVEPPSGGSTVLGLWRARIQHYVDMHLADPELSPNRVAERFRVSRRYVHKIFATGDETLGQYILRRRLECCHRSLGDPRQGAKTIAAIAFEWGFNNTTHFGRVFDQRYGMSPSRHRRGG